MRMQQIEKLHIFLATVIFGKSIFLVKKEFSKT